MPQPQLLRRTWANSCLYVHAFAYGGRRHNGLLVRWQNPNGLGSQGKPPDDSQPVPPPISTLSRPYIRRRRGGREIHFWVLANASVAPAKTKAPVSSAPRCGWGYGPPEVAAALLCRVSSRPRPHLAKTPTLPTNRPSPPLDRDVAMADGCASVTATSPPQRQKSCAERTEACVGVESALSMHWMLYRGNGDLDHEQTLLPSLQGFYFRCFR